MFFGLMTSPFVRKVCSERIEAVQDHKKSRNKVGVEGSESVAETQPALGETVVSRGGGNTPALWSLTQETHTTTRLRA
jgi:hypothetical protein